MDRVALPKKHRHLNAYSYHGNNDKQRFEIGLQLNWLIIDVNTKTANPTAAKRAVCLFFIHVVWRDLYECEMT